MRKRAGGDGIENYQTTLTVAPRRRGSAAQPEEGVQGSRGSSTTAPWRHRGQALRPATADEEHRREQSSRRRRQTLTLGQGCARAREDERLESLRWDERAERGEHFAPRHGGGGGRSRPGGGGDAAGDQIAMCVEHGLRHGGENERGRESDWAGSDPSRTQVL